MKNYKHEMHILEHFCQICQYRLSFLGGVFLTLWRRWSKNGGGGSSEENWNFLGGALKIRYIYMIPKVSQIISVES